jgi:hypothetical protein
MLVSERLADEPAAERNSASRRDDVELDLQLAPISQPVSRKNAPYRCFLSH